METGSLTFWLKVRWILFAIGLPFAATLTYFFAFSFSPRIEFLLSADSRAATLGAPRF